MKFNFDIQQYIAGLLVTAVVVLMFVLVFHPIKDADDITKMLIGGVMTVGFATIIGFYFGSSKGSKDKDNTLSAIASSEQNK